RLLQAFGRNLQTGALPLGYRARIRGEFIPAERIARGLAGCGEPAIVRMVAMGINLLRSTRGTAIWQRGYYERSVGSQAALDGVRRYIALNQAHWSDARRSQEVGIPRLQGPSQDGDRDGAVRARRDLPGELIALQLIRTNWIGVIQVGEGRPIDVKRDRTLGWIDTVTAEVIAHAERCVLI